MGWADQRALPMMRLCRCIIKQAQRSTTKLRLFILEAVMDLCDKGDVGETSPLEETQIEHEVSTDDSIWPSI